MLKHGRAGVPMEVMGLMLGEFVDDYTVRPPIFDAPSLDEPVLTTIPRSLASMSLRCPSRERPSLSNRSITFSRRKCWICSSRLAGKSPLRFASAPAG